jgi:hypothetical protein
MDPCPKCGRQAGPEASVCADCGHDLGRVSTAPAVAANGESGRKLPPEVIEWARRTFDEEEFLAGVREICATGGLSFEDFVEELERAAGQ